jgi:hypothetical protein
VYEIVGLLLGPLTSNFLDIAKSKSHSFRNVDIAKSHSYSRNSKLVTSSDLSNMTSRPLKNSLKSYDDFTMSTHPIIAMSTLNTAMSTPTSECIKTIAKCIKIKQKTSKFSRKSRKSFLRFRPKSKNLNRRIRCQNQDRTPTSRVINDFQIHHEKLSKIKIHELLSGSVYFMTNLEYKFFFIHHHEADFILVFYPQSTCPTLPKGRPPASSCREKEKIIKPFKNG